MSLCVCLHLVANSRVGRSHCHGCADSSGNEGAHNGIADSVITLIGRPTGHSLRSMELKDGRSGGGCVAIHRLFRLSC